MFKGRIKVTGEVANFNTSKNENGDIMVQKDGSLSFFKPDEVENIEQLGWNPASELPKHSGTYIVIGKLSKLPFYATNDLDGKWCIKSSTSVQREFVDIDWWCYPPKEE